MTIAVIGWGSLLWNPRHLRHLPPWRRDGPHLPVEFARQARDGRVSLVSVDGHPTRAATFWAESDCPDIVSAVKDLAHRERTHVRHIHLCTSAGPRRGDGTAIEGITAEIVEEWLGRRPRLGAALWTGLGVTRFRVDDTLPSQVVSYVGALTVSVRSRAREYVERAPATVDTPVRQALEREFGWARRPLPGGVVEPSG